MTQVAEFFSKNEAFLRQIIFFYVVENFVFVSVFLIKTNVQVLCAEASLMGMSYKH